MRTSEQSKENLEKLVDGTKELAKYSFLGLLPEQKYISSKINDYDRMKAAKISGAAQAIGSVGSVFFMPEMWMIPIALFSGAEGLARFILTSDLTEKDIKEAKEYLRNTPPELIEETRKNTIPTLLGPLILGDLPDDKREKFHEIWNNRYAPYMEWLYTHGTPIVGAPYAIGKKAITTIYNLGYDVGNVLKSKISSLKDRL